MAADPERVVALARSWIGTPYRHQASAKGAGADCLGVIRGIWADLYGEPAEAPPPYSAEWTEVSGREVLWRAAMRWLEPGRGDVEGDVLLFRMARSSPAKHLGVRAVDENGAATFIHAYSGQSVIESFLSESWRRRVVAAFRFP